MRAFDRMYRFVAFALLIFGMFGITMVSATSYLGVSVSPAQSMVDSGQSYTLTGVASTLGGTSVQSFSYQWYNVTGGQFKAVPNATGSALYNTAGAAGKYSYELEVTSALGNVSVGYANVSVEPDPMVSFSIGRVVTDVNGSYQLVAYYTPGSGIPSYQWSLGGLKAQSGCGYPNNSTCVVNASGALPGVYNVSVSAKDSAPTPDLTAPATVEVVVNSAPSLSLVALGVNNASGTRLASYSVSVVGGTGPFQVVMYNGAGVQVGSAMISAQGSALITFNAASGPSTYYALAHDLGTSSGYSFRSASVKAGGPTTPASNSNPILGMVAFLIAIIVAVVYYFSYMERRARNRA
jgi:hypothetical protein